MSIKLNELIIGIKSAGEIASGIACRLFNSNITNIFMMDTKASLAVRRGVSFCEVIPEKKNPSTNKPANQSNNELNHKIIVEGVEAKKAVSFDEIPSIWNEKKIPVIVDPEWACIKTVKPHIVIDAIIAKKNLGTNLSEASLVIGLGPGFEAGKDVHIVIETNRGHNLGKVILKGSPEANTGIPGSIGGFTHERVLRAPCAGIFKSDLDIGAMVKKNQVVAQVNGQDVIARIDGVLRGQIRDNTMVKDNLKIGDIDPRGKIEYCTSISEKARAIGGSILEAVLRKYNV
ncbi:MAG: EF2563 family selenium-dependent molybdenum hydroxylase system protein [Desulfobacula sp.]|nr:EF2563 family selenium-dependent molybdenum hydroxylase system protein [Desulfobacula sp.]